VIYNSLNHIRNGNTKFVIIKPKTHLVSRIPVISSRHPPSFSLLPFPFLFLSPPASRAEKENPTPPFSECRNNKAHKPKLCNPPEQRSAIALSFPLPLLIPMSTGYEDLFQILQPGELNPTSSRRSKVSYTREFLLSLSDLELCKRLPKGFDESFSSEFGSSPLHYSSSPPEKGETSNFSRGVDRWDSRVSGRSDTDSHSDKDSDTGRRYGNQFRWSWQNPEHDGLLGSGTLPRPPGFRPGASVPRANDQPQLKKSSDPYHPPRPYKAAPHPRRETKDSYNDETFGWGETTSEDRSEEERKRRTEFEMMRKEQHKELQQKMKSKVDKLKDDPMTELAASLDSGSDAVITSGSDTSLIKQPQQNDPGNEFISSQGHQVRPLVPPGFANSAVEKISGPKSLEVGKLELGLGNKDAPMGQGYNNCEITSSFASKGGIKGHLTSSLEFSSKTTDSDGRSFRAPNISEIRDVLPSANIGIDSGNLNGLKVMGETGQSTSILEKLFGGALSLNSSSPNTIEDQNMKSDDAWSPKDSHFQTSKFVHLFVEEGGEKCGLLASETKTAQQTLTTQSDMVKLTTSLPTDARISEVPCNNNKKPDPVSAFLTCEDLEQSMLSNVGESSSCAQPPEIYIKHGIDNEIKKAEVDKNASQHLLSLLQLGTSVNSKNTSVISVLDNGLPTEPKILGDEGLSAIQGNVRDEDAENLDSGKGLTLETLFGTAFMKELKSADAPVSVQKKSSLPSIMDVSEPSMPSLVVSDDRAATSSANDARFKRVYEEDYISRLGAHQTNLDEKVGVNWLNVDGSQTEMESPNLARFGMQLPEEDSLTSLSLPANAQMFPSSTNPPANIAEKLAALGVSMRGERPSAHRQDNPAFFRGPFDMVKPEIPHHVMHAQSSPQFNSDPMNHGRPMFHLLDPHAAPIDPQINFMPRGGIDAPVHHQFPANMAHSSYRHPSSGLSEFDHPIHPMLQQLHMPNNNHLAGFPGGAPPPHSGGNVPGYIQEHNLIHGFPFGQQQPNLGGHGMRLGPEHGDINNQPPPQTLQRILEMELRSSQNPMHHPGSGHSRPAYGHELDSGLWYR
ncbi:hypothetical protein V2J09_004487, partial [Rumex salicifolius]